MEKILWKEIVTDRDIYRLEREVAIKNTAIHAHTYWLLLKVNIKQNDMRHWAKVLQTWKHNLLINVLTNVLTK